jgi:Leucine-rich repeat (LRR) protein
MELYIKASRLRKIPESIGQLKHLEKIVLRGCHFHTQLPLATLPDEFCQLSSFSYLGSLPNSFGNLIKLQDLVLNCAELQMLPDSSGEGWSIANNTSNITHYALHCTDLPSMETLLCVKLRRIHGLAQNLTKLKQLDVANCYK